MLPQCRMLPLATYSTLYSRHTYSYKRKVVFAYFPTLPIILYSTTSASVMTITCSARRARRRPHGNRLVASMTIALATILAPGGSNNSGGSSRFAHALSKSIIAGPTKCPDVQKVQKGSYVRLHYTGTIAENSKSGVPGTKFDSSYDSATATKDGDEPQPFETQVGVGKLIKGWDLGLLGLCLGTKARLTIPPSQAYGQRGFQPSIPPGATLQFDVEIVDVANYKDRQVVVDVPPSEGGGGNLFALIDTNRDGKLDEQELQNFFSQQGSDIVPPEVWRDDADQDGTISWVEFTGPKGDGPPNMEDMKKKMEEQDRLREEEQKRLAKEARQVPDEDLTPAATAARRKLRAKKANRKKAIGDSVGNQSPK